MSIGDSSFTINNVPKNRKFCSEIILSLNSKINKRCLQGTGGPALKSNEILGFLSATGRNMAPTWSSSHHPALT